MSVIVKGMEMPKSCGKCPMMRPGNYKGHAFPCTCHAKGCFPIKPDELDLRDGLCPLIEVPPHGRLIDADAFIKEECNSCDGYCEEMLCDCLNCKVNCRCDFIKDIADAPTIIEEEGRT